MVRHEGEKMAKSVGNLIMVRDLLQTYSPDAIRAYLLGHHYRTSWEYDETDLKQAGARVERYTAASRADAIASGDPLDGDPYRERFVAALDDDLDTPTALSIMDELSDVILAATGRHDLVAVQGTLREFAGVMGFQLCRGTE